jgi:hypothetical protein
MGGTYYPLLMDPQAEILQLKDIPTIQTVTGESEVTAESE